MNSVKVVYLICCSVGNIFFLLMAVITPIYLTPGYYWWTALFIFFVVSQSKNVSKRMNSWEGFGSNE